MWYYERDKARARNINIIISNLYKFVLCTKLPGLKLLARARTQFLAHETISISSRDLYRTHLNYSITGKLKL